MGKKLTPAKRAAKTAKFRATMAAKRASKAIGLRAAIAAEHAAKVEEEDETPRGHSIPLSAIPDRPARPKAKPAAAPKGSGYVWVAVPMALVPKVLELLA